MNYTNIETQDALKEQLKNGTLLVSFTKKNGERRDMHCTLAPSAIPKGPAKETTSRPTSSTSLAVYDVNAQGWRSFCWDSIIEVK